jgi:hypothetical protein
MAKITTSGGPDCMLPSRSREIASSAEAAELFYALMHDAVDIMVAATQGAYTAVLKVKAVNGGAVVESGVESPDGSFNLVASIKLED